MPTKLMARGGGKLKPRTDTDRSDSCGAPPIVLTFFLQPIVFYSYLGAKMLNISFKCHHYVIIKSLKLYKRN